MTQYDDSQGEPPKIAQKLLHWALPATIRDQLMGDLFEEFEQLHGEQLDGEQNTLTAAQIWFWRQSVSTVLFYLWKEKGGIMAFVVSLIIFVGFTLSAMLLAGGMKMFWDIPSVLIVIPPAIAFGIAASSVKAYKDSLALSFVDQLEVDKQTAQQACDFLNTTSKAGMIMGWLMTLIGWVAIGNNLKAETFAVDIGPSFAVSILTVIYGLMLKVLCDTAAKKIEFRYL